jgi:hypothetical protein
LFVAGTLCELTVIVQLLSMKAPWISPINSANTERPQSPVIAIMFQFQEHSFVYKQEIKFNTHTKDRKANRNNTCCYHTAAKSCK